MKEAMYIPKDLVKLAIVPEEVLRVISVTTPVSTWKDNSIVNSLGKA